MTNDHGVDLAALLDEIRDRAEARRASGELPADLEASLARHFEVIASHERKDTLRVLEGRIADVDARRGFTPERIATDSRLPGGSALHRAVASAVRRQTQGVLSQVQEFADAVLLALDAQVDALRDVRARVEAVYERLTTAQQLPDDTDQLLADLVVRLRRLEGEVGAAPAEPAED